jgi:excisionase family DNA binding protein
MPEEYLTVDEVATMLRLVPQTVRNMMDRGDLPFIRIGRRVRIKRSDFDRFVERGYTGGGRPQPRAAPSLWEGEIPDPQLPPA